MWLVRFEAHLPRSSFFYTSFDPPTDHSVLKVKFFLFQFYDSVTQNEFANYTLRVQRATIFAPTNQAFQLSNINSADFDVLYHMGKLFKNIDRDVMRWFVRATVH